MKHYRDKSDPNYPHVFCGASGMIERTEVKEDVECVRCKKYIESRKDDKRYGGRLC